MLHLTPRSKCFSQIFSIAYPPQFEQTHFRQKQPPLQEAIDHMKKLKKYLE